jgi:hypothetical protein
MSESLEADRSDNDDPTQSRVPVSVRWGDPRHPGEEANGSRTRDRPATFLPCWRRASVGHAYWARSDTGRARPMLASPIALRGITTLPFGSEPWLTGVLALATIFASAVFILGGWLWIQREVSLEHRVIHVRRWIDVLARRRYCDTNRTGCACSDNP